MKEAHDWNLEADTHFRQGHYEEAILCLNKSFEIDPKQVMI